MSGGGRVFVFHAGNGRRQSRVACGLFHGPPAVGGSSASDARAPQRTSAWDDSVQGIALLKALASVVALATASVVASAPQPLAPPAGSIVRSAHPVLRWELPANERSEAVYIAKAPDTTPQGTFYSENVVTSDFFGSGDPREWAPERALYAGHYWWMVQSEDRDAFATYRSAPIDFTIPVSLRFTTVRLQRQSGFLFREVDVTAHWTANLEEVQVEASVLRGRTRLWTARETEEFVSIGTVEDTDFEWSVPRRVKRGTRLVMRVTLRGGGGQTMTTGAFRAP